MTRPTIAKNRLGLLLLASTMLGWTPLLAQEASQPAPAAEPDDASDEVPEISVPGGGGSEIVVIGRRIPNTIRVSREVVSVLTQADIARTGEGDIAGALQRLSGLSVVGGRFVYVRGLGERYSLALLNGLPIPSPDPLRRVIPLDIFPTSILASSVVQKSYSANFPGEFGGGVINLTTRAIPEESFFTVSGSFGGNTVTTSELGVTYQGGGFDATGFDDGTRRIPGLLQDAQNSGKLLVPGADFTFRQVQDITASLINSPTTVIQRNTAIPANFGVEVAGGHTWDVDGIRFGVVANLGWKNNWQTKAGKQQNSSTFIAPGTANPSLGINQDYDFFSTENRAVVNGLLGVGMEFDEHKIRLNTVYVHDTIKEARIQDGINDAAFTDVRVNRNSLAWFERQLIQTQAIAELRFDQLSVDLRGTYANSKRLSPYERDISYAFTTDFGINDFVNDLRSPGQSARVAFSRLNENVYGAGIDLGYKLETGPFPMKFTAGYAFSDNQRSSVRRDYRYQSGAALPVGVSQQRADFLLSDFNIYTFGIVLNETSATAGAARYDASLTVHAGYGMVELEPADGVQINAGVRYEKGRQIVNPVDLFGSGQTTFITRLNNDYFLPAATVTWNFAEDMQFRFSASKTIARPQFREQAPQVFLDTENDRESRGNQFLVDSQLINAEARYEWYFGRDERFTISGFWKKIDRPIETVVSLQSGFIQTTYANAPEAELYGAELDVQKYFALDALGDNSFLDGRRFMVGANYTFTNSSIKVADGDTTIFPFTGQVIPATDFFRNGQPLTGQSDHVANLQIGFSDQDSLSEQTLLLNYASNRATSRGPDGQPDLIEKPGLRLDAVIRQGFTVRGLVFELKLEGRNLTNVRYQEFQSLGGTRVDNNTFELGRTFTAGLSATF